MKEWIKVSHQPGRTSVTVVVMDENLTARWTEKTSVTLIGSAVKNARKQATAALTTIKSALEES
jgi:hypothetical protein